MITCASLIGLVFIAPTVISSITKPSLGDTAIVLTFKLIIRTAMIGWGRGWRERRRKFNDMKLDKIMTILSHNYGKIIVIVILKYSKVIPSFSQCLIFIKILLFKPLLKYNNLIEEINLLHLI